MTRRQVVSLEVQGLRALTRDLKQLGEDLADLKAAGLAAGNIIVRAARPPVRSGKLAASGRASKLAAGVRVLWGRVSVPYAGPIHWGWPARNIGAQPFAVEAAHRTEPEWLTVYAEGVDAAVERRMEARY